MSDRHPARGPLAFLHVEAVSGVVLLAAAAAAFVWANSPFGDSYYGFWHAPLTLGLGSLAVVQPLHFYVNDVLMTVFFLVVGMEIRREIHDGSLSNLRLAWLPLAAAAGGVAVPATIYLTLNIEPVLREGWAVPTATDIAFAVGVLALLGRSIPSSVRVFLLAIAIIDDIAAVVIIATFYSDGLDLSWLFVAGFGVLLVLAFQQFGIGAPFAYVVPGAILWFGLLKAGVHPTMAGVVLGLMTPVVPMVRVEAALHPWVAYGIMPLFALANAGVSLTGLDLSSAATQGVLIGVAIALVVGKPVGIFLGSWLVVRLGWCYLPDGVTWRRVALVGCLGGIGFTMSIFIATLAFGSESLLAAAKSGVLIASVVAGVVGFAVGRIDIARLR